MAVTLRGAGGQTGNVAVTAVDPATHSSTTIDDLCVLAVCVKPYTATITTPTDWVKISEHTNGTTAQGTDTGSMKIALYVRTGLSGAVSIGNISQSGANSMTASIMSYQNSTGGWNYSEFVTGGDTSNGANYSGVQSADLNVAAGDMYYTAIALNSDAGSPSSFSPGSTSGGFGFGSVTLRSSGGRTTGNDCRMYVVDWPITSGSGAVQGPFTYTDASSQSGAQMWLRIQEVPVYSGDIAQTLPAVTQAISGTFVAGGVSGDIAQTLPGVEQSAAGTFTPPVFNGTIAQTLPKVGQSIAGTVTPPVYSGDIAQTLPSPTQSATGTTDPPVYSGDIAQVLPSLTQSMAGTITVPVFSGVVAQTLPSINQSATGTFTPPQFTATVAQTLPAVEQSITGTYELPAQAGSITQLLPSVTQSLTGTTTVPVFSGDISQLLPAVTMSASGQVENPPSVVGSIAQLLPFITQELIGTTLVPVYTGAIDQLLPRLNQQVLGTVTAPRFTANITQVLPMIQQSLSGSTGVAEADPVTFTVSQVVGLTFAVSELLPLPFTAEIRRDP